MTDFDFRNPDYTAVIAERIKRLERLREQPEHLPGLKAYYSAHLDAFINDFGTTSDPRARNRGLPIEMPFVLFNRQRQMIEFIQERMRERKPGLIEKSRDCGASWLACCFAASLCLFERNVVVGIGSRTESKVDRSGDPDSLFWKIKFFLTHLPPEFRGNWDESRHSAHMRVQFPETGSAIVGEAGDGIGRGGRSTIYFIDEAAFIERPQLIEASLASNADCRIDISTPNGRANSFATKRHSGKVQVFTFGWRDDDRKDDAWYQRQVETLDPVTLAQEVDLSYDASIEGILLPSTWVQAAVGAHMKLGIEPTGVYRAALDVADEGKDKCAFVGRHGIVLKHLQSWSGKNSDIYRTVVRTFGLCEQLGYGAFDYDADGLGAGVRGDAVDINGKRREAGKSEITADPFRGSAGVFDPEGSLVEGRLNKDYFANLKAQAWWALRLRLQATYRAVVEGLPYNPDQIISIDPELPELTALVQELVQPTYSVNQVGKIVVDKTPDGALSPNLADAVMICFSPFRPGAYFAAPAPAATNGPKVYELPSRMDHIFAVVSFLDDAAAAVFCAANDLPGDGTRGPPFHVLDWDLLELGPQTEVWVRGILQRLAELHKTVGGLDFTGLPLATQQFYLDDPSTTYTEFLFQRGIEAASLDRDFTPKDALPPVSERFAKAKPYINLGSVVIDRPAHEREIVFRGSKRNFLRELLSQASVMQTNALAQALSSAVLLVFKGAPAVPLPKPAESEESELIEALGMFGLS